MKIKCPICNTENIENADFCSRCGYQLSITQSIPGEFTRKAPPPLDLREGSKAMFKTNSGKVIEIPSKKKVTVGRDDSDSGVYPDLDLTPYNAEEDGVSRLHLEIECHKDGYFIRDLNSTNETLLNGARIEPLANNRLVSGDMIQLGELTLQFIVAVKAGD